MVTMDKDYGQLVEDGIYMYKPSFTGNGFDTVGLEDILKSGKLKTRFK